MFRLQVWCKKHWRWGIAEYDSMEEATARVAELKKVGIRARVKLTAELYAG